MKRFQPFVGRAVDRPRLDGTGVLEKAGLVPRYLPDAFEEFDEMEFLLPFQEEKKLVLSVALEQGRIQRMLFGWVGPGDPEDAMRSLDEEGLTSALELHGAALIEFLEEVTV